MGEEGWLGASEAMQTMSVPGCLTQCFYILPDAISGRHLFKAVPLKEVRESII